MKTSQERERNRNANEQPEHDRGIADRGEGVVEKGKGARNSQDGPRLDAARLKAKELSGTLYPSQSMWDLGSKQEAGQLEASCYTVML